MMMMNKSSLASCLLVVAATAALVHSATAVRIRTAVSPSLLNDAMAQIDAQVNAQLARPSPAAANAAASMRFMQTQQQTQQQTQRQQASRVSASLDALNSMDLKALAGEGSSGEGEGEGVGGAHPRVNHTRQQVAAYIAIAYETMVRADSALRDMKQYETQLMQFIKVEKHDLQAWVSNERGQAEARIKTEETHLGRLTDEVQRLRETYHDAVAKEQAYRVQLEQLVSERQLQTTPPVMPAVAQASLSAAQFREATRRLTDLRTRAQQLMQTTAKEIATRQHMITASSQWVANSRAILQHWLNRQERLIGERTVHRNATLAGLEARIKAVQNIFNEAKQYRKEYHESMNIMNMEKRISTLEADKAKYAKAKAPDAYDQARNKAFVDALELEIKSLREQIGKMPGQRECRAPPGRWGVLASVAASSGQYSADNHVEGFVHPEDVANIVPTAPDGTHPIHLMAGLPELPPAMTGAGAGEAAGKGEGEGEAAAPSFRSMRFREMMPRTVQQQRPMMPQQQQQQQQQQQNRMAPPTMPHLPPPPDADMAQHLL